MPSERSKALWERSIPLSELVMAHASNRIAAQPLQLNGRGWKMFEMVLHWSEALWTPGTAIERIREQVRDGAFIPTGYRNYPSKSFAPVAIAISTFVESRLDILSNAIIGDDVRYSNVRIGTKAELPSRLCAQRPIQSARRRAVEKIIIELSIDGQLPRLRKQQIPIVRNALAEAGINNVGLDKTLERIIRNALMSISPN